MIAVVLVLGIFYRFHTSGLEVQTPLHLMFLDKIPADISLMDLHLYLLREEAGLMAMMKAQLVSYKSCCDLLRDALGSTKLPFIVVGELGGEKGEALPLRSHIAQKLFDCFQH